MPGLVSPGPGEVSDGSGMDSAGVGVVGALLVVGAALLVTLGTLPRPGLGATGPAMSGAQAAVALSPRASATAMSTRTPDVAAR